MVAVLVLQSCHSELAIASILGDGSIFFELAGG